MKKYFKIFSLLLIAGLGFFLGTNITKAVTAHEFFYDYEFNIKMPTTLTNGENDIILSPVETNPNNTNVELDNIIISYKVTEVSKEIYEEFKALQDKIDAKTGTVASDDADIVAFNALINEKYIDKEYWCYNDPTVGKITINTDFCGTKYYIITVDAEEPNVLIGGNIPWNYKVARAYEVTGTKTDCTLPPQETPEEDTTNEESPKTGVITPYVILGSVIAISTVSIAVSKKKKFI